MPHFRELAGRRHFLTVLESKAERMPGAARATIQHQIGALRREIARLESDLAAVSAANGLSPTAATGRPPRSVSAGQRKAVRQIGDGGVDKRVATLRGEAGDKDGGGGFGGEIDGRGLDLGGGLGLGGGDAALGEDGAARDVVFEPASGLDAQPLGLQPGAFEHVGGGLLGLLTLTADVGEDLGRFGAQAGGLVELVLDLAPSGVEGAGDEPGDLGPPEDDEEHNQGDGDPEMRVLEIDQARHGGGPG